MRTRARLAAPVGAAAAATTLSGLAPSGTSAGAGPGSPDHDSRVAAAIAAAKTHSGTTKFGSGQKFNAARDLYGAVSTRATR
jgi:hypothetical protein